MTAAVPSLIASPALAENTQGGDTPSAEPAKAPAKHDAKKPKKIHAAKGQKAHAKADAKPDAGKAPEGKADAKKDDKGKVVASAKGKKTKKTAQRGTTSRKKSAKKSDTDAPGRPCFAPAVTIDRMGLEGQSMPLVDCHGAPLPSARLDLSLLARPWGTARPALAMKVEPPPAKGKLAPHKHDKGEHARAALPEAPHGVRYVDPGLLSRLEAIRRRFPGRTFSLVSGYRPQSKGSQHQLARALDLRVAGVTNEELVAFCKTLADTGCGYYPNSSFVHVDVRNPGTGMVEWIDASGPGEPPRYVSRWPEPDAEPLAKLPPPEAPEDHAAALQKEQVDPTDDDDDQDEPLVNDGKQTEPKQDN
ncbi:MAG: DUF882 domain-containing protein [Byssovorax sp.]